MTNAKFYFWGIVAAVAFFQFNNAIPANALPIGIKEDFNGCSTSMDTSDRARCCKEVEEDCKQTCHGEFSRGGGAGGWIACEWDCDDGLDSCKAGEKVPNAGIRHICKYDQSKDKKIVSLICMFESEQPLDLKLPEEDSYEK